MNKRSLSEWLGYIESLHSSEIEFGLERVKEVYKRLFPSGISAAVVTVAGTNGKGTTCAYIESMLLEAGYTCGKHTSPHLINFQERINIGGAQASDTLIVDAFERVELARATTQLTYFEFTFLAALSVFEQECVEFAVCEVGLGGRLDAVNILEPEVSVITMVGLDHTDWLGNDLGVIATEKAGIARTNKPCIVGMDNFPSKGLDYLKSIDSLVVQNGVDYEVSNNSEDSYWSLKVKQDMELSLNRLPDLFAPHLSDNAACAILAVHYLLKSGLMERDIDELSICNGLSSAHILGRCQIVDTKPLVVLDVAHNEDSVNALSVFIDKQAITGKTVAVFSMLADKDIRSSLTMISKQVDIWYISELKTPRALSLVEITQEIRAINSEAIIVINDDVKAAYKKAKRSLTEGDCMLVFGSFWVVGDILQLL